MPGNTAADYRPSNDWHGHVWTSAYDIHAMVTARWRASAMVDSHAPMVDSILIADCDTHAEDFQFSVQGRCHAAYLKPIRGAGGHRRDKYQVRSEIKILVPNGLGYTASASCSAGLRDSLGLMPAQAAVPSATSVTSRHSLGHRERLTTRAPRSPAVGTKAYSRLAAIPAQIRIGLLPMFAHLSSPLSVAHLAVAGHRAWMRSAARSAMA
jgi:hypothetical protein